MPTNVGLPEARKISSLLVSKLGATDSTVVALQKANASVVLQLPALPTVDGYVLTDTPANLFALSGGKGKNATSQMHDPPSSRN